MDSETRYRSSLHRGRDGQAAEKHAEAPGEAMDTLALRMQEATSCVPTDPRSRFSAASGEESEESLCQTQKMEALGRLAAGLAHDFNNLLGVILGYCALLEEHPTLPGQAREMISQIQSAGTSASNLSQGLLAFIRQQPLPPAPLDLNQVVNRMQTMLGRLIGDNVELVSVLSPRPAIIKAGLNQVEQVLMNLVINARDAMPQGGKITIETGEITLGDTHTGECPLAEPGPCLMLAVTDTGAGMDPETQSHVFEPFFSTKAAGKGTGLGLSIVSAIVKQAGGAIAVDSLPGQGTTFKIYFPRCHETSAALQAAEKTRPLSPSEAQDTAVVPTQNAISPMPADPRIRFSAACFAQNPANVSMGGTETILLVDDSGPLRQLTRRLLEDCGYKVLESGNPVEALRIARDHRGPLSLLITDLSMPGFSGSVLAEKLAPIRPETRVLYTSGYNDGSLLPLGVRGQDYAFLEKPFTRDDLLKKVRELLDSPPKLTPCSAPAPDSTSRYSSRLLCG